MEAAKELATARDKKGCIALHLALENHLSEQVEEQTKTDRERLISCLLPTNLPTDTVLKMVRARTGLQRGRGYTAVHLAAQNGTLKAMLYILEKGEGSLKLDNLAENNCTLLHLAVKGKQSAIARKLLQKAEESTSEASCEGPTLFKALLSPDADGRSPLHQAVIEGHPQLVEFLVEKGADFNAKDKDKYTPLDLVGSSKASTSDSPRKRSAITEIKEYLLSKNAESNQPESQQWQQLLKKFKDLSKNITLTLSAGSTGVNISLAVNNLGSICCGGEPDVSS
jgi:ankyrin repeat protein